MRPWLLLAVLLASIASCLGEKYGSFGPSAILRFRGGASPIPRPVLKILKAEKLEEAVRKGTVKIDMLAEAGAGGSLAHVACRLDAKACLTALLAAGLSANIRR